MHAKTHACLCIHYHSLHYDWLHSRCILIQRIQQHLECILHLLHTVTSSQDLCLPYSYRCPHPLVWLCLPMRHNYALHLGHPAKPTCTQVHNHCIDWSYHHRHADYTSSMTPAQLRVHVHVSNLLGCIHVYCINNPLDALCLERMNDITLYYSYV